MSSSVSPSTSMPRASAAITATTEPMAMTLLRRVAALITRRATPAAPAPTGPRIVGVHTSPLGADGDRNALNNIGTPSSLVTRWIHAITFGKILANEVSPHGGILPC